MIKEEIEEEIEEIKPTVYQRDEGYYIVENGIEIKCDEEGEPIPAMAFIVKVTLGWEMKVITEIMTRLECSDCVKEFKDNIYSMTTAGMPGYIIIEAESLDDVNKVIGNQRISPGYSRVKGAGRVLGEIEIETISQYLQPKKSTERFHLSDIVEITAGSFRGEMARVIDVKDRTEELQVEMQGTVPIILTLRADHCRVMESVG